MDRINIKCLIADKEVELQLDKKAMPGEAGPCFMITQEGCFKGYISLQKNRTFGQLGACYFTDQDIQTIGTQLEMQKQV
ncbi:hypothetical protein [Mucilaginibacter pocheonensis]|uniref:TIGR04076 family protein n=1 Tax=Mucilaginibacter pocheonensis TaxID=398050 RepID=A0ABU1TE64_9SPHI|nr:hypothetical protein [Mucilaginibacter pocheonensis]MDR6943652.1 hypothetical protein [Mucilaginibacter pocheonensis]